MGQGDAPTLAATVPATMPAIVLAGPGQIDLLEVPVPDIGRHDVLIEVDACGICGTDLHLVLQGWGAPGVVPGHEYAGHVAVVGQAVTDVAVGDAVTANPQPGCGDCVGCRRGRPSLCRNLDLMGASWQGGFARYVRVAARQVHRLPDAVAPRVGALAEPLAVALHAIDHARLAGGDRVLVTGAGPLGLLVIAALRHGGVGEVVVSEPSVARRARAERVGASWTVMPTALPDPVIPPVLVDAPFDAVIECSGSPAAVVAGLRTLRGGGRLVLVGAGLEPVALDATRVMVHELEVVGAINYGIDGFGQALDLLASGVLPIEDLVEPAVVAPAGFLDACRQLAAGTVTRKLLVAPG